MKYIAYYRVSTAKQGRSGLGLEAQKQSIASYVKQSPGELVSEFTDIESGSKNDRPELLQALRQCRLTGATLLIAKLDRLSRNRRFLLELADSTINFVAVDMPEANSFTVGLMACLADYERQVISERTKAALKAAKARGVKLGNPNLDKVRTSDTRAATKARSAKAKARNAEMLEVISEVKSSSDKDLSTRAICQVLNEAGYTTARGGKWHPQSVARVLRAA